MLGIVPIPPDKMLPLAEAVARYAAAERDALHVAELVGFEPLAWQMTMLGYDGYRVRAWAEPIEDEL